MTRKTSAICLYALLFAPAVALAQPEQPTDGLPLPGPVPPPPSARADLTGHWLVPGQRGEKGSVTFGAAQPLPNGSADRYSIHFSLPSGRTVDAQGTFDGELLEVELSSEATASASPSHRARPEDRTGLNDALEAMGEEVAPAERGRGRAPADDQAGEASDPAPAVGTYRYSVRLIGRSGEETNAATFVAQGSVRVDGPMPVAKFGRADVKVRIVDAANETGPFSAVVGGGLALQAQVSSPAKGRYEWSGEGLQIKTEGDGALVTAAEPGRYSVSVTFVSAAVGSRHEAAALITVAPKITAVNLTGLTFTSDHGLLKDNDTDWTSRGKAFPEPEWTPAAQHPITHTMGQKVALKAQLTVEPKDAGAQTATLVGKGPGGLEFKQEVELQGGKNEVQLTSTSPLEKKIQALDLSVAWSLEGTDVALTNASTQTTVYVTYDTPTAPARRPGVTLKRMKKAIEATSLANSTKPHEIVKRVIRKWNHYNLKVAYRNAWELGNDKRDPTTNALVGADCQTIVRFTQNAITQVGVPGTAEFVVVYAKVPDPATGVESLNARNHMTAPMQRYNDHNTADPAKSRWIAALVDGGGGLNNYEAALRFTHNGKKYYPGGVNSTLDNANQVIGVFTTMSWVDLSDLKAGPKEHIHHYRRP